MKRLLCWLLGHDIPPYVDLPYGSQYIPPDHRRIRAVAESWPCTLCGVIVSAEVIDSGSSFSEDVERRAIRLAGNRVVRSSVPAWIRWAMPKRGRGRVKYLPPSTPEHATGQRRQP